MVIFSFRALLFKLLDIDLDFVKTFITTFRSFTTPGKLFDKLLQRFNVPLRTKGDMSMEEWKRKVVTPIQLRVVNFVSMWLKTRFQDFDYALIKRANSFIDCMMQENAQQKWGCQLSKIVRRKIYDRATEAEKTVELKSHVPPISKIIRNINYDLLFSVKESVITQHLCVIEFNIYQSIQPVELLNQAWNKKELKHRAPNVMKVIKRFNETSNWVVTAILNQFRLRTRAKLVAKFIKIAIHLFQLNNFNSCLAIISGVNNAAIHRLKFTREEVSNKLWQQFDRINAIMSDQHYESYREHLHSIDPPVLPYLGVYLTDLTFIEDGNKDYIGGLINFKKRELTYNVISEIQQYQQKPYDFVTEEVLVSFLTNLEYIDEEKQWNLSLQREPRSIEKASELP